MIEFSCPVCSKKYAVPEDQARKRAKCGQCGERMIVPESTPNDPAWWKPPEKVRPDEQKASPPVSEPVQSVPTMVAAIPAPDTEVNLLQRLGRFLADGDPAEPVIHPNLLQRLAGFRAAGDPLPVTPPTNGLDRQQQAPPSTVTATPLPEFYASTRDAGKFVEGVTLFAGLVGALGCFFGAIAAWGEHMTIAGWTLLGIAVAALVNIAIVKLFVGATQLLLDIGESLRELRPKQKEVPAS